MSDGLELELEWGWILELGRYAVLTGDGVVWASDKYEVEQIVKQVGKPCVVILVEDAWLVGEGDD